MATWNKSKRAKIKPRQDHEDVDRIYMLSVIRKMSSPAWGSESPEEQGWKRNACIRSSSKLPFRMSPCGNVSLPLWSSLLLDSALEEWVGSLRVSAISRRSHGLGGQPTGEVNGERGRVMRRRETLRSARGQKMACWPRRRSSSNNLDRLSRFCSQICLQTPVYTCRRWMTATARGHG